MNAVIRDFSNLYVISWISKNARKTMPLPQHRTMVVGLWQHMNKQLPNFVQEIVNFTFGTDDVEKDNNVHLTTTT